MLCPVNCVHSYALAPSSYKAADCFDIAELEKVEAAQSALMMRAFKARQEVCSGQLTIQLVLDDAHPAR